MQSRIQEATKKLVEAAEKGSIKDVRAALDNGADINLIPDRYAANALERAAAAGNRSIVVMLLKYGASAGAKTNAGSNALHTAAEKGHLAIVELLAQLIDVNSRDNINNTPIHFAALNGRTSIVKFLLRRGANIKLANKYHITPLYDAALHGRSECVEVMVNHLIESHKNNPQELLNYLLNNDELNRCLELARNSATFRPLLKLVDFMLKNTAPHHYYALNGLLPNPYYMTHKDYKKDVIAHIESLPIVSRKNICEAIKDYKDHPYRKLCNYDKDFELAVNNIHTQTQNEYREVNDCLPASITHNLNWAAKIGDVEAAEMLAKKDPNTIMTAYSGDTPLDAAVRNGHTAVVEYFVQCTIRHELYGQPVSLAAELGHTDVIYALDKHNVNLMRRRSDYGRTTPIMLALKNGKTETAMALLECKAFTNIEHPRHYSELYYAVYYKQYEVLNAMVDQMCTWDSDQLYNYAMHNWAFYDSFVLAMRSNTEALHPLLRLFQHLNRHQKFTRDNIHHFIPSTCLFASQEFKQTLLSRADSMTLDEKIEFYTEITTAGTALNKLATIRRGATACDATHQDSILFQAKKLRDQTLAAKKKKKADSESELYVAAKSGVIANIQKLIAAGVDVNASSGDELYHPIIIAAYKGHVEAVKLLHQAGADINKRISEGEDQKTGTTALLAAAENGQIETVRYLLDQDADIHLSNSFAVTPLLYAAICGHNDVVSLLLSRGADIFTKSKHKHSALHFAASHGNSETLKLLIDYLIAQYSAETIYTFVKDKFSIDLKKAKNDNSRAELMKLIPYFAANHISETDIKLIYPEYTPSAVKSTEQPVAEAASETVVTPIAAQPAEAQPVEAYPALPEMNDTYSQDLQTFIEAGAMQRKQAEALPTLTVAETKPEPAVSTYENPFAKAIRIEEEKEVKIADAFATLFSVKKDAALAIPLDISFEPIKNHNPFDALIASPAAPAAEKLPINPFAIPSDVTDAELTAALENDGQTVALDEKAIRELFGLESEETATQQMLDSMPSVTENSKPASAIFFPPKQPAAQQEKPTRVAMQMGTPQ